jgi:hypothetical protein
MKRRRRFNYALLAAVAAVSGLLILRAVFASPGRCTCAHGGPSQLRAPWSGHAARPEQLIAIVHNRTDVLRLIWDDSEDATSRWSVASTPCC